jgi:hypothetical protein
LQNGSGSQNGLRESAFDETSQEFVGDKESLSEKSKQVEDQSLNLD